MILLFLAVLGTVATFFAPVAGQWVRSQLLLQFPTLELPPQVFEIGMVFVTFVVVLLVYFVIVRSAARPR